MDGFVDQMNEVLEAIGTVLWHPYALYTVLGIGVLFTIWTGFCQYRALTHGTMVILGKYSDRRDPGAINHFQALSAALSATVGLGNIGGVAVAVALGGPGAVFWMWIIGIIGMALKTVEVTLAMMYRNLDDPENPHGGAMYVADKATALWMPGLAPLGKALAILFCITLLISTVTGGNMFQAWNVADATASNFGVPRIYSGLILSVLCGLVIIGGIKVIGAVAGVLVPFMCLAYVIAGLVVLGMHVEAIPGLFALIFRSAFNPAEAQGAFIGGTVGSAFTWGLKRAFFSNEAGQGSSPIAHCAAKTKEPAREGLVAGLEPFIDTLIICTLTSLVILASGAWNRGPEGTYDSPLTIIEAPGRPGYWVPQETALPTRNPDARGQSQQWDVRTTVAVIVRAHANEEVNGNLHKITGKILKSSGGELYVEWVPFKSDVKPVHQDGAHLYTDYGGASLTSHAFDRVIPGLGRWLVTVSVWLFALSTVISWSYYGEQGMIYMFGNWSRHLYRLAYCLCLILATTNFIRNDRELDNLSSLGTGIMLFVNLPICLLFSRQTIREYHRYVSTIR